MRYDNKCISESMVSGVVIYGAQGIGRQFGEIL